MIFIKQGKVIETFTMSSKGKNVTINKNSIKYCFLNKKNKHIRITTPFTFIDFYCVDNYELNKNIKALTTNKIKITEEE